MKLQVVTLFVCVFLLGVRARCDEAWAEQVGAKKLIYYGWGVRDTQYVRDHWRQMEQMPFDGTGISIAIDRSKPTTGDGATVNLFGWQVIGQRAFQVPGFREAIADLREAKWTRFTDNFLPVALSTGSAAGLNWFDDERWRIIANNFRVLTQVAKEGGLKGLILDPEHYNYDLFRYQAQRQQVDRSFETYAEAARRRGREVMRAIAGPLSDVVLLSLFGHTLPLSERKSLHEATYGLLPAFYDGLIETMPAGGRLIDGYEHAYPFKERAQFLKGYRRIREEAIKLSAVPDQYRERVRAGFGLWLDYANRPDFFTPDEFRRAVGYALEATDGYVWIYTQGPSFFPLSGIDPSYIDAIAAARRDLRREERTGETVKR